MISDLNHQQKIP